MKLETEKTGLCIKEEISEMQQLRFYLISRNLQESFSISRFEFVYPEDTAEDQGKCQRSDPCKPVVHDEDTGEDGYHSGEIAKDRGARHGEFGEGVVSEEIGKYGGSDAEIRNRDEEFRMGKSGCKHGYGISAVGHKGKNSD